LDRVKFLKLPGVFPELEKISPESFQASGFVKFSNFLAKMKKNHPILSARNLSGRIKLLKLVKFFQASWKTFLRNSNVPKKKNELHDKKILNFLMLPKLLV
jgi:hypothetical protein